MTTRKQIELVKVTQKFGTAHLMIADVIEPCFFKGSQSKSYVSSLTKIGFDCKAANNEDLGFYCSKMKAPWLAKEDSTKKQ